MTRDLGETFDMVDLARSALKAKLIGAVGNLEWAVEHRAELEGEAEAVVARLAGAALKAQRRLDLFEKLNPRNAA